MNRKETKKETKKEIKKFNCFKVGAQLTLVTLAIFVVSKVVASILQPVVDFPIAADLYNFTQILITLSGICSFYMVVFLFSYMIVRLGTLFHNLIFSKTTEQPKEQRKSYKVQSSHR